MGEGEDQARTSRENLNTDIRNVTIVSCNSYCSLRGVFLASNL